MSNATYALSLAKTQLPVFGVTPSSVRSVLVQSAAVLPTSIGSFNATRATQNVSAFVVSVKLAVKTGYVPEMPLLGLGQQQAAEDDATASELAPGEGSSQRRLKQLMEQTVSSKEVEHKVGGSTDFRAQSKQRRRLSLFEQHSAAPMARNRTHMPQPTRGPRCTLQR